MALPVTIAEQIGQQNSYHGPFRSSAGNIYTILIETTAGSDSQIAAFKADDTPPAEPTGFTEVDSANRPQMSRDAGDEVHSLNIFQKSDMLHVATQDVGRGEPYYARFNMGADAWVDLGASNMDAVVDAAAGPITAFACDLIVLDDDKIRVVYQGEVDKVMGTDRERVHHAWSTNGGDTFTAALAVGATGDEGDSTGPRIATDGVDAWVVWNQTHQADVNNVFEASIHPDNTLQGTLQDTGETVLGSIYPISHGVVFDRLGIKKVRFLFESVTGLGDAEVLEFDVTQDPTIFSVSSVDTTLISNINNSVVGCLASDGSTVHCLFSLTSDDDVDSSNDQDTDTWTAGVQDFASTIINHISCNVIWRDGPKLAYVMDDNGTVKYNEKAITYTLALLSDAEMADQNQFAGPFEV